MSEKIYDPVTADVPGVDKAQRAIEIEAIHSDPVPQPPPKKKQEKIYVDNKKWGLKIFKSM